MATICSAPYSSLFKIAIGVILIFHQISDSCESDDNSTGLEKYRVICYYASWSVYREGIGKFTLENINPNLCTHIIYAFGSLSDEGTLKPADEYADIELGGYDKFTGIKAHNKDLKAMLSFGGTNDDLLVFAEVLANPEIRQKFINSSITLLRQHNFDGLDLDWQFPQLKDRHSYTAFIGEFREEFDIESNQTGKPRLILTITLPKFTDPIDGGYDIPTLTQYVDWMNVLTYNYHKGNEPVVNHHSPLYRIDQNSADTLNSNSTITSYLDAGAERNKLVLGIPSYGRTFILNDPNITDIGSPAAGLGSKDNKTTEDAFLAYYEICKKIKDEGWIAKHPYPNAMGPYAYKDDEWVSYDDENTMRLKSKFVAENKLGGVMFWLMEYDDFKGSCTGEPYPLIKAAKKVLLEDA